VAIGLPVMTSPYPVHRETDVVLRDGRTMHLRPARPEDRTAVEDYLLRLSPESRRLRFWGVSLDIGETARSAVEIDHEGHETLLALSGSTPEEVVGGGQFISTPGTASAEVGVSVADDHQGLGLGSILIAHLAQAAAEHGIVWLHADVLPENHAMLKVFRETGYPVTVRAQPGAVEVDLATAGALGTIEQYEERERLADATAVRNFLHPRSIAVIGASRDATSIGGRLLGNLLEEPFEGVVYPVNPNAPAVQGVTSFPTVLEIPGPVDLAFVAVPATQVAEVARACGDKGVRSLVVISAGFREAGAEGERRQAELLDICRSSGMRLIGPNCMGIVNTDPHVRLNGTFASVSPHDGRIGFMSQSGALGIAVMNLAESLGTGLSSFVSIGNKADISGNDLLSYWQDDERTEVILLYLESFGNPRRFGRLCRTVARDKPIVVVKSGRGASGNRATASHTGALLASSDSTVEALFRQNGVIRTDTLEEMFDVATLLASQPVPRGPRVAIVTNAGGLGIQCADMCEAGGLEVPELSAATVERLRAFLPAEAGVANPIDMVASARGEDYARTIAAVTANSEIDALIVIYIPPLELDAPDVARYLVEAIGAIDRTVPVLTCFMSARGVPDELRAPGLPIPSFAFPEQAAIALTHAWHLGQWRAQPASAVPDLPDVKTDEAVGLLARALQRGEGWLRPDEVDQLLTCYGVATVEQRMARDPEEAARAAAELGGLTALKMAGPLHKTEVGAVRLGLTPDQVADEARAMAERVEGSSDDTPGFLLQPMIQDAAEMLVGIVADPQFGPVVACGAGGTTVELIKDVQVGVAPLTEEDARSMVRSLTTFPLLDGFRGASKKDVDALVDILVRISSMAEHHSAIVEMDCNPVMVMPRGAVVVDSRVRVRAPELRVPFAGRLA
jgi:acetyl coenzyme A synthetase (ADP forming)-like protein